MRRLFVSILLVIAIIIGGWALYHKEHIGNVDDFFRLAKSQLNSLASGNTNFASWSRPERNTVRVASFNIQVFGNKKASQPEIMATLAEIIREFDIVAIQEIRSTDKTLLSRFVDQVNSNGRNFRYVISERLGRSNQREQYAYIFDMDTVQLDGAQSYTIHDPDDLLRREPLVASFRTTRAAHDKAFTFTLVNLHLDSRSPQRELVHLNQIFRAIRNDGRGEDDVIIVGDFNIDSQGIANATEQTGLTGLISVNTNTRANQQYDNIIIDSRATTEFTGRAGVFDFLKHYNLSLDQALDVSDHLPVWAEFSLEEGGLNNLVAEEPSTARNLH